MADNRTDADGMRNAKAAPPAKINWRPSNTINGYEAHITHDFVLRVELASNFLYRAAVLSAERYGSALYRSSRTWTIDEAKRRSVRAGMQAARRRARISTWIADYLKRASTSDPRRDSSEVADA